MREVKELKEWWDESERSDKVKAKQLFKTTSPEIVTPWQNFLPLTASVTGLDEMLLKDLIEHIFTFVKDWINDPKDKAAILLNELGSFELNLPHINMMILKIVPFLRGKDRDKFIAKFKWYWQARQLAIAYKQKRTSTNRKFYPSKPLED